MAKVEFTRVETDEEVENINIKDGQLIYTGTGKTYMDYGNQRIPTGSGGSSVDVDTEMSDISENAVQNKVIKEYVDNEIETVNNKIAEIGTTVNLFGNVGGSSVGTFDLYSHIVATKINSNTWKFEIEGQIDISNATHQYYWGIMPSKISDLLNSAIGKQVRFSETIRTLGTWEAYSSSTKLPNLDKYGYGTVFQYNANNYLLPARYYQTGGAVGGWALDNFENGSFMKAIVYLKEI